MPVSPTTARQNQVTPASTQLHGSQSGDLDFGTGRDQHQLRRSMLVRMFNQYVAATRNVLHLRRAALERRQALARQDQAGRAVKARNGRLPRDSRFDSVARAPQMVVRNQAQAGRMFDRLVGRAVFAQTDRVMGQHVDHALLHQRRHPDRVARIIRECHEGAAIRDEAFIGFARKTPSFRAGM